MGWLAVQLKDLCNRGYTNLLCTPRNDLNLLNFGEVQNWFNKNRPEVVILAAAKVGGIYANLIIALILSLKILRYKIML